MKKELEEVYNIETEEVEKQERYKQVKECYSKIDLMKYLAKEYRKGSEASGR